MLTQTITSAHAALILAKTPQNGQMFGCSFIKKNGELRSGTFRLSSTMTKDKNGVGMAYDPTSKGLMPVWCMKAKGYRMINVSTITRMKVDGIEYIIDNSIVNSEVVES